MTERKDLSRETQQLLDRHNLRPLWELEEEEFGEEREDLEPELWTWDAIEDSIDRIEQDMAMEDLPSGLQRRVGVPVNPSYSGAISHTIYIGIQTVSPGETAPSHRHGANALRFTINGNEDLRTVVGGEAFPMHDNDLVTTPQWEWHDHHNGGDETAAWLDVLDLPLVFNSLNIGNVFEDHSDDRQEVDKPEGFHESQFDVLRRTRAGTREEIPGPFEGVRAPTPPFRFQWTDVMDALEFAQETGDRDPHDGVLTNYTNPSTGETPLFPTFGVRAQLIEGATEPHRHNATEIYYVVTGDGATHAGDRTLEWSEQDIFVVPPNAVHNHDADTRATLLVLSDRPLLEGINLYHEVAG